ncbi:MAG: helix-turn-helix domain-containing protein [Nannocystaceae bacterium]
MSDSTALTTIVGRMTVGDLARHIGVSVEDFVAAVLEATPAPVSAPPGTTPGPKQPVPTNRTGPETRPRRSRSTRGREPTRKQLHHAVDRWLIGEALEQEDGNISQVARRLATTRSQVRKRWALVDHLSADEMARRLDRVEGVRPPPTPEQLRALGTFRAVHDAVDRWLVPQVLEQEGDNISRVAKRLGTSRLLARKLRARLSLQ